MMYDFIIFEHSGLHNHILDLKIIGKMLKDCGYSVAMANVNVETNLLEDSSLPIIKIKTKQNRYRNNSLFLKAVIEELSPQAIYFYGGSVLASTSLNWLKYVPNDKIVFIWALRSYFFTFYKRFRFSKSYFYNIIRSINNTIIAKRKKNIHFFVSNNIIKDEFISLGYEPSRLVIREERTTLVLNSSKDKNGTPLSLLLIGSLRPEKRIDLCIDAIKSINDPEIHLTIAGKAYNIHGFDKKIDRLSSETPNITRVSHRLSNIEYINMIKKCDYLILCDEKQPSCVTNGTMAEALLTGRPIIAPNYNPYKYVVENYNVGLLYDIDCKSSLMQVLKKAKSISPSYFSEGIKKYQQDLMYKNVLHKFAYDIKESLKNCSYGD